MPWVGFGTYKLGQSVAKAATLAALRCGYRAIDTAYIYAGEKCEPEVGKAIASPASAAPAAPLPFAFKQHSFATNGPQQNAHFGTWL